MKRLEGASSAWPPLVLVAVLLGLPLGGRTSAQTPGGRTPTTVRLLTVGNSFSQDATRYLPDVVKAQGDVLVHHQAGIPGGTLQQHCEKADAHAKDPADPRGLYVNSKLSLVQELKAEPWDFVTIQQASIRSHDYATYQPFADRLVAIIKELAPGARIVVHETWAYRRDDPRFDPKKKPAPGEPADQEAMYHGLAEAYHTLAGHLEAPIIPVGDAFHIADADAKWGYRPDTKFDLAAAVMPALPDQTHSLHVGRKWVKQEDGSFKMTMDGHHSSVAGRYLGALTFYESLYGKSVVGCTFRPNGVNAEYAAFLQESAHQATAALKGTSFQIPRGVPASASR
ncbi:DUF4886 domain-containing protein [Paludisphaera rhizosphaerae]|uniref:DUF4886 domain-containing protein n=1 Tax=Paludisphaera rhizosphaerae TaxID=2711216 RepID=UPI0013E9A21D|nr:DUF4886 domain-containing protein [Paludisphaera rhizosphaerae]